MNANSRNESVILSNICIRDVNEHYHNRETTHEKLEGYLTDKAISKYVKLAVGVTDHFGNYSAYEHRLGDRILHENSEAAIFSLAQDIYKCSDYKELPKVIKAHNLRYIKISVGTEMAMMLRPNDFWVANARTIWAHNLITYGNEIASELLQLYRDGDSDSEMAYKKWTKLFLDSKLSMDKLYDTGITEAKKQGVTPGTIKYLWADAIAAALFNEWANKRNISQSKGGSKIKKL